MSCVLLLSLVTQTPLGQLYLTDPGAHVPVLPHLTRPRLAGGWLPPPAPPSEAYIRAALAGTGRVGDVLIAHRLDRQQFSPPRELPGVGRVRIWTLSYRCDLFGPDGPYTIYTDRTALVQSP